MEDTLTAMNERDGEGCTALMWAVRNGYSAETLRMMVNSGAEMNARDDRGRTLAMHALLADYPVDVVVELTSKDTVNASCNVTGDTLLAMAARDRPRTVEALLKALVGVPTFDPTAGGNRTLEYAVLTENERLVCDLLTAGADARCPIGDATPLICAAKMPSTPTADRILRRLLTAVLFCHESTV